jgi:transcriptional regulator with XRE-family HTH domain
MDEETQLIIDRIRAVRQKLGITQGEFAHRMGMTQTALSMIEVGRTRLSSKNIKLICVTFNVDEVWLRTGSGAMFGSLSAYEKEFLEIFRRLSEADQEFVLEMARNLLRRQEKKTLIPVPLS